VRFELFTAVKMAVFCRVLMADTTVSENVIFSLLV
jgi:hypothetical protein